MHVQTNQILTIFKFPQFVCIDEELVRVQACDCRYNTPRLRTDLIDDCRKNRIYDNHPCRTVIRRSGHSL